MFHQQNLHNGKRWISYQKLVQWYTGKYLVVSSCSGGDGQCPDLLCMPISVVWIFLSWLVSGYQYDISELAKLLNGKHLSSTNGYVLALIHHYLKSLNFMAPYLHEFLPCPCASFLISCSFSSSSSALTQ